MTTILLIAFAFSLKRVATVSAIGPDGVVGEVIVAIVVVAVVASVALSHYCVVVEGAAAVVIAVV